MSSAVVAAVFDIIILWHGREHQSTSHNLAHSTQDDFRAPIIDFDWTLYFDHPSRKPAYVADIFQIVGKDDYCEWTSHLVFAEIQKVHSL